jgi:cell filamentation protein
MHDRYNAYGPEAEYEPGSRGRVLRNLCGIHRIRDMEQAESEALVAAQDALLDRYTLTHRFIAADICAMHREWLGGLYAWAGEYRSVNIIKGGFPFAAAEQVPRLMAAFEQRELAEETPCAGMESPRLAKALARTHAELVLIHPFREGNGRCAPLLAYLMAIQAGLPSLHFDLLAGRGKRAYIAAIQTAMDRDYAPLEALFLKAITKTLSSYAPQP